MILKWGGGGWGGGSRKASAKLFPGVLSDQIYELFTAFLDKQPMTTRKLPLNIYHNPLRKPKSQFFFKLRYNSGPPCNNTMSA